MNTYSINTDYLVASNNSVNENNLNAKKARSTLHQIKRLLKSLTRKNKKTPSPYEANGSQMNWQDVYRSESDDNLANELLEARIFQEIDRCEEYAALPVYTDDTMDIIPISRGQRYIPVNFARTEAGTFFWTSISNADCDISSVGDKNAITRRQLPQLQVPCDRWAQA